jgi:hypothetical protein
LSEEGSKNTYFAMFEMFLAPTKLPKYWIGRVSFQAVVLSSFRLEQELEPVPANKHPI